MQIHNVLAFLLWNIACFFQRPSEHWCTCSFLFCAWWCGSTLQWMGDSPHIVLYYNGFEFRWWQSHLVSPCRDPFKKSPTYMHFTFWVITLLILKPEKCVIYQSVHGEERVWNILLYVVQKMVKLYHTMLVFGYCPIWPCHLCFVIHSLFKYLSGSNSVGSHDKKLILI